MQPVEMANKHLQVEQLISSPAIPSPQKHRDSYPALVPRKFTPFKQINELENPSDADNDDILEGGSDEKNEKDSKNSASDRRPVNSTLACEKCKEKLKPN